MVRSGRHLFAHGNAVRYRACHLPRDFCTLRHRVENFPDHIVQLNLFECAGKWAHFLVVSLRFIYMHVDTWFSQTIWVIVSTSLYKEDRVVKCYHTKSSKHAYTDGSRQKYRYKTCTQMQNIINNEFHVHAVTMAWTIHASAFWFPSCLCLRRSHAVIPLVSSKYTYDD